MTNDEFIAKRNNNWWDYDGYAGFQCKDLFSYYNRDVVGNPNYVWGDAWQLYGNAPDEYYEKIPNTASFVPQKGDWCIWPKSYGGYGHVGMVISANVNTMDVMCQNYKGNQEKTQIIRYGYINGMGFLRKKGGDVNNALTPDQARIVYQNALLREPENNDALQGRSFDEMMGGVKEELTQRFDICNNKPPIIKEVEKIVYQDKLVEVPAKITDAQKQQIIDEYKATLPITPEKPVEPTPSKGIWQTIIDWLDSFRK